MKAIHLCCGAGGTTLGFERAGIRTAYAFDLSPVAAKTHKVNFPDGPVVVQDIREVRASTLPKADVWTCGIPCENYSLAGSRSGVDDVSLELARLLKEAAVAGNLPVLVFLENVKQYQASAPAVIVRAALREVGLAMQEAVFKHADFGVCQTRERWHLVASALPPVPWPRATHSEHPNLFGLKPWVRFGEVREREVENPCYMSARALKGIIRRQRRKTNIGIEKKCGVHRALYVIEDGDLMNTVMAAAHRGIARNQAVVIFDDYRFRLPTELELRRVQAFPDDFVFCGSKRERIEQIGRAVPPPFAEAVARAMLSAGNVC